MANAMVWRQPASDSRAPTRPPLLEVAEREQRERYDAVVHPQGASSQPGAVPTGSARPGWAARAGITGASGDGSGADRDLTRFGTTAAPSQALNQLGDDDLAALVAARGERAEPAMAVLYDRYSSAVYGLGLRMLRNAALAEELLQETFWRVWQHAGSYEAGRVRFATWLLRVASNHAIGELRKAARRPRLIPNAAADGVVEALPPALEPVDPAPEVPEQVWMVERRRLIAGGLARLPAAQREAVELAYFGGLSHSEIAATQGAPASTVKTRLSLGLRKLAEHLRAAGLTARDARP